VACSQRYQSLQSESFSSCAWNPIKCGHILLYLMAASPAHLGRVVRMMVDVLHACPAPFNPLVVLFGMLWVVQSSCMRTTA
jgi:hypothetical protein